MLGVISLCVVGTQASPGCRRLEERQAIRRYAQGFDEVRTKLRALDAMETELALARRRGDAGELRRFLEERYLPVLRAAVDAMSRVPQGTKRLRSIHAPYHRALARSLRRHEAFAGGVTPANLASAWEPVARARKAASGARQRYRKERAAYFRKHDVRISSR